MSVTRVCFLLLLFVLAAHAAQKPTMAEKVRAEKTACRALHNATGACASGQVQVLFTSIGEGLWSGLNTIFENGLLCLARIGDFVADVYSLLGAGFEKSMKSFQDYARIGFWGRFFKNLWAWMFEYAMSKKLYYFCTFYSVFGKETLRELFEEYVKFLLTDLLLIACWDSFVGFTSTVIYRFVVSVFCNQPHTQWSFRSGVRAVLFSSCIHFLGHMKVHGALVDMACRVTQPLSAKDLAFLSASRDVSWLELVRSPLGLCVCALALGFWVMSFF